MSISIQKVKKFISGLINRKRYTLEEKAETKNLGFFHPETYAYEVVGLRYEEGKDPRDVMQDPLEVLRIKNKQLDDWELQKQACEKHSIEKEIEQKNFNIEDYEKILKDVEVKKMKILMANKEV